MWIDTWALLSENEIKKLNDYKIRPVRVPWYTKEGKSIYYFGDEKYMQRT
jgi:hypothetical protein